MIAPCSNLVQAQVPVWEEQGLFLFYLPPYSPEMNQIEGQWLHLKRQELAGRIFDDEYDLALAIIQVLENRGEHGVFSAKYLTFN